MVDIQLTGQGSSANVEATGTISGTPVLAGPKTTQDSISSANGTGAKKGYSAEMTPELMQALYILYNSGHSGPQLVQLVMGNTDAVANIDPALFKLEIENKLNEICIGMLNAWSKSIADQVRREREEEKSPAYQQWEARRGQSGYEAYLNNLPPLQRLDAINFENHDRKVDRLDSTHNMLTSYVEHLRSNPSSSDNLPFMSSAITIGLSTQFDYAILPASQANSAIGVNPIRDSSSSVMQIAGPGASELGGYLGGIIIQAASWGATAQALLVPAKAADELVNKEFAKAFARNVLTEVSGPGFAALAAGLFTSEAEKGGSLNQQQFTDMLRASLLSTAFSLLYATEPSITEGGHVYGRTMNGIDFTALANGQVNLANASEQMKELYGFMKQTIDGLGDNRGKFIVAFADFVEENKDYDSWSQLKHIRGLLNPGDVAPVLPV